MGENTEDVEDGRDSPAQNSFRSYSRQIRVNFVAGLKTNVSDKSSRMFHMMITGKKLPQRQRPCVFQSLITLEKICLPSSPRAQKDTCDSREITGV